MKKRFVAFLLVLIMVLGMLPVSAMAADDGVSPQALESNETRTIKYQILYVGDEFNIGYNYGASVNKTYTCQYSTGHSGFNHSILISEFRNVGVPALKDQLDSGYEFVGWAKEAKKNPTIFDFNTAGTTATQTTYTIYLVAKKTNPTPTYMYYLYYKYNDGTNSTWLTEVPDRPTTATTFTFHVNTAKLKDRRGYEHIGWADKADAAAAKYTGGEPITLTKDDPAKTIYAVWMPFFELKYDANGGTGAPDSQTRTASHPTVNQVTFTVPNQIPTKEGYTFKGWADSATATDAQYQPGGTVAVKHADSPKTVYAVWEESDPQPPFIPAPSYDDLKSAIGQIQVKDVSTPSCGTENYDLIDNTESEPFNWTKTARADQPGKYDVTIQTAPYVAKYNSEKTKTHELNNANQTTLRLVISYENSKWVLDDGLRVIEVKHSEQTPPVDKPNPPTEDNLLGLYIAKVYCAMPANHGPKDFTYLMGTLDTSRTYTVDENGFCTVYLSVAPYVAAYNGYYTSSSHARRAEDPATVPVTLFYNTGRWEVAREGDKEALADIPVYCAETPVKPAKPTELDGSFAIVCKNNKATHPHKADYIATPSQYTISDVQTDEQGYYVTATVTVAPNLVAYNTLTGAEHRLVNEQDATLTITFRYDTEVTVDGNRKWKQQGEVPVVEVICKPKAPTADELKELDMAVLVKCVVDDSQQHTEAYGRLGEYDEDYFVGEPRKDGDDWLCDINYYPERYVAEFNTTFQNLKHVQNDEKIVPVTLIWAGDSWQLKTQGRVHVTEEYTVTYTDGVDGEEVFADQVYSDLRKDSATPAFNGTPTRTGYTFAGWEPEVAETVTQTVTYVAKWEKKTYKVVAKLYVNGKPAYYQNEDFYTYKVSGLYGENIDFDTIKAEAVEQAKQIKKASASYTAVILEDHEPNPVCTTFGEHQPGQATHYVKVNVKTEENVVIFQSFEGKTDLTKLHTTTAPYGTNVVEFLNGLGLDLDVAGYTLDTAEDGNTNWYKKDSPKWTFGANDTINGWTNVLLKYTITPHNIYAFARLNSAFAPLTSVEFGEFVKLNDATLTRLGLGSYNANNYISIGTFSFNKLPLMGDDFMSYYGDEEFDAVVAELADNIVLETGVSKEVAEKIAWTYLFKADNSDYMTEAGYPTDDENGYQLSGNLNLASVTFRAGAENVENMPAVNYTYDDGAIDFYDFYFAGDTITLPTTEPTREGYSFEGWSVKVIPAENDADHLDADGADDAADETLLKAGDTYTITAGGVIFTAQWEARTDTPYTVEHYLENLDGSYALDTTEPLKGTTDTTVTAAAKSYDNFTYDSTVPGTVASGNIAGDGSLVLKLFYTRNTYDYTVRHIKQLPDGTYDEANAEVETLSGKFEALAAVTAKDYGSHYPTNDADTKQNIKIEKGLTIDVKYDLDEHTLTFETNGGSAIDPVTVRHGNAVARPADPTKDKYTFIGWYVDPEFTEEYDFATVLEADKTIYAKFELTSTPIGDIYVRYDVLHIKQLPDGSYDLANAEVEHLSAKKDTTVTAAVKDYSATHHINVNSTLSKLTDTAIQPYPGADGKPVYTILSVYYDLDFHTLTFDTMGGSRIDPVTVRHGNAVAKPKDPVNGGYIFDGWYTDKTYRTPYNFATVLTQDTTIYAKWFLIALPGVTIKKTTPKLNTSDHFAYVQGYPDGTVKPTGNITRAETAAILFRLMDEGSRKTYYSTKSGFRDVATGSWYNTYVATLNNAGVITDSSNGYFRPNEAITRAELAAMLANFTETAGAANYFNDVSARYWAANAIAICAKLGWITGYPDGSFRPDRNVTRAELMAMINRATGRAPKSADAFLPGMKTWSDNTADKWYYLDVQEATNSHSYTVKDSEKWTALNADPNWSLYE